MARVRNIGLDERRLEQTRVQIAHNLSRADRREIGRALSVPLGTERVAEREQDDCARKQGRDNREHQQRCLAALPADERQLGSVAPDHSPPRCRAPRYGSTHTRCTTATTCRSPSRGLQVRAGVRHC
jgi:hypothetical protein